MASGNSNLNLYPETYEFRWTIPNWASIRKDLSLIKVQEFKFETGAVSKLQTKWRVGFEDGDTKERFGTHAQLYCKLLEMNTPDEYLTLQLIDGLLTSAGSIANKSQIDGTACAGTVLKSNTRFWSFNLTDVLEKVANYIDIGGSITFLIRLTLFTSRPFTKMERFEKTFTTNLHNNLESLLNDSSTADLVLVTKDKTELYAHKAILGVRSENFGAIIQSECLEKSSSTVKVDDISQKTMRILLHFWYTGKLLPSWQDNDTIVEFVHSAGKYEVTELLDMINETLAENNCDEFRNNSIDLLKIVHKLSLKKAERRLFDQIIKSINHVKSCVELFTQLGIKYSEMLDTDEPGKEKALVMLNAVLTDTECIDINFDHVRLLGLLQKLSLYILEQKLLHRIVQATNKVKTVEEFFVLFGYQEQKQYNDDFLLLKALPSK